MRYPISLVRSVTDTSMIFIMPATHDQRDGSGGAEQQAQHVLRLASGADELGQVAHLEIVGRAGAHMAALAEQGLASFISSAEATSTMMPLRLSGTVFSAPKRRLTGTMAISV
jgi:hypothetical protein